MKKYKFLIAALFAGLTITCFSSCGDDDDEKQSNTTTTVKELKFEQNFYGPLVENEELGFFLKATPNNALNGKVTLSSSDEDVVEVTGSENADFYFVAKSKGTATITAKANEATAKCEVLVVDQRSISFHIGLSKNNAFQAIENNSLVMPIAIYDVIQLVVDTSNYSNIKDHTTLVWTSSDKGIVTVDKNGQVLASNQAGTATITASLVRNDDQKVLYKAKLTITTDNTIYDSFNEAVGRVEKNGVREISVEKGDTIIYCVKKYWEDDKAKYGPFIGYLVIDNATNEKISISHCLHPAYTANQASTLLYNRKETSELSDTEMKNRYQCFGVIGIDHPTGTLSGSFLSTTLGYEGIQVYFEKTVGKKILTNIVTKYYKSNTDTTKEEDYPEVVFLKVKK